MSRKFGLYAYFAGNSSYDHGRAVFVANIVLQNQNGANAALFAAHHGA